MGNLKSSLKVAHRLRRWSSSSFACLLLLFCTMCQKKPPVATPGITLETITKQEGQTGYTPFNFKVTLSHAAGKEVSVGFTVTEGLAKAGSDFVLVTLSPLVFKTGEVEKTITINVVGDDIREADEDFTLSFNNVSGANVSVGTARAIIQNDDTKVPFSNSGYTTPLTYAGKSLVWADEFNGPMLDGNNWSYDIGDGCPQLCGWGNNELQFYTASPDNVFLQNGALIIEARKQTVGNKSFTSGRIKSEGKRFFKFGRIDIRAISPRGQGIWPALWMMPQNNVYGTWPNSGEIDLMEVKGNNTITAYQTVHFGPGPPSTYISRAYTLTNGDFSENFHVYSLLWSADTLQMMIDDVVVSTVTKADLAGRVYPFNEAFYFIFNTAVGGNFLPSPPDATTNFPQWLIIDYVRVFQ